MNPLKWHKELAEKAEELGLHASHHTSVKKALENAKKNGYQIQLID